MQNYVTDDGNPIPFWMHSIINGTKTMKYMYMIKPSSISCSLSSRIANVNTLPKSPISIKKSKFDLKWAISITDTAKQSPIGSYRH